MGRVTADSCSAAQVEALKEELADAVASSSAKMDLLERQLRAAEQDA